MTDKCTCDMRTQLVGDGCEICNPDYIKTDITKLAREISLTGFERRFYVDPENPGIIRAEDDPSCGILIGRHAGAICTLINLGPKLAQTVLGSTVKGERMPQIPEQFQAMGDKYEKAMIKDAETISKLKTEVNKLKQKLGKAKAEQREKDALISECYPGNTGEFIAEKIREQNEEEQS